VEFDVPNKRGLSIPLVFVCSKCNWRKIFNTSKEVRRETRSGRVPFEINARSVVAMREIGKGHSVLEKLCGYLNMPPPMNVTVFNDIQKNVFNAYSDVVNSSMNNAADELRISEFASVEDQYSVSNTTVSCDGSWQKRGYASLNGVVTVIASDTGKCLDYRVRSKVCKSCQAWETKKDSDAYEDYISNHKCTINHTGSAGSMEAAGLVECFVASVPDRKLRYTQYILYCIVTLFIVDYVYIV
jgi:hypothetical protein